MALSLSFYANSIVCNIKMSVPVPVNKYEHLSIHYILRTTMNHQNMRFQSPMTYWHRYAFYKFCGNKFVNSHLISQFNTLHVMEVYLQFILRLL